MIDVYLHFGRVAKGDLNALRCERSLCIAGFEVLKRGIRSVLTSFMLQERELKLPPAAAYTIV